MCVFIIFRLCYPDGCEPVKGGRLDCCPCINPFCRQVCFDARDSLFAQAREIALEFVPHSMPFLDHECESSKHTFSTSASDSYKGVPSHSSNLQRDGGGCGVRGRLWLHQAALLQPRHSCGRSSGGAHLTRVCRAASGARREGAPGTGLQVEPDYVNAIERFHCYATGGMFVRSRLRSL